MSLRLFAAGFLLGLLVMRTWQTAEWQATAVAIFCCGVAGWFILSAAEDYSAFYEDDEPDGSEDELKEEGEDGKDL